MAKLTIMFYQFHSHLSKINNKKTAIQLRKATFYIVFFMLLSIMGFAQTNSFTLSSSIGLTSDFTSNARIADFDNDGDNDIANFDGVGGNYRLYKNNGNGTFANTFTELIPVTNQAIETGDLDNDGV